MYHRNTRKSVRDTGIEELMVLGISATDKESTELCDPYSKFHSNTIRVPEAIQPPIMDCPAQRIRKEIKSMNKGHHKIESVTLSAGN